MFIRVLDKIKNRSSLEVAENYKPKSHSNPYAYILLVGYTMQHTPLRVIEQIILNTAHCTHIIINLTNKRILL
jgi:hypothetical protein